MTQQFPYQSILSIDDHKLLVSGMQLLTADLFQNFHAAYDGNTGVKLALLHQPDLIITDYMLPDTTGDLIVRELKYKLPKAKIIAYTFNANAESIKKMFGAGVNGYVIKSEDDDELLRAIEFVLSGKDYFCKEARNYIINHVSQHDDHPKFIVGDHEFTDKEIEIIKLICKQKTAKEICGLVYLSERTVEQYRSNITKRIGAQNMGGIIKFALKNGILGIEDL